MQLAGPCLSLSCSNHILRSSLICYLVDTSVQKQNLKEVTEIKNQTPVSKNKYCTQVSKIIR